MDDRLHELHAELEDTHWWFVGKNRILESLIRRYAAASAPPLPLPPRLLDIGCGAGGLMARLADSFEVVGVETSPLARAAASRRGMNARPGHLPHNLPFDPRRDRFEVIVMSEVLEHVEADRASVEAVATLLAPGGLLVCTVPAHPWLWSSHDVVNHHVRRYTRETFAALFRGLPLTRLLLSPANLWTFPVIAAVRLARRIDPRRAGPNPHPESSDLRPVSGPINRRLASLFASERYWLPHAKLPFGASLVSVHRRDDGPVETHRPDIHRPF